MSFLKDHLAKKYLHWRLARWKAPKEIFDFASVLRKVRHVLIVIPEHLDMDYVMPRCIQPLYQIFGENIMVSTFEKKNFRAQDSNWLGLPKKEYLKIFESEKIDLVLDLNEKEDAFCSYVCALLNAPIKINLAPGKFEHIYNLHIRSQTAKTFEQKVQTMLYYLKHLFQPTT